MPVHSRFDLTVVPDELLENESLSWAAKGLYAYLLMRGDGFQFELSDLADFQSHCSTDRLFDELERHGAVTRDGDDYVLNLPRVEFDPPDPGGGTTTTVRHQSPTPGSGWVYVLTNPAFDLVKVGYTTRNPYRRCDELSRRTSVPADYELAAYELCAAVERVETKAHELLNEYRHDESSEFFDCTVEQARQAIARADDAVNGGGHNE
ncbi:MAG: GIY-YIG nuclease family protein [Bradymonadaceae bacterium]